MRNLLLGLHEPVWIVKCADNLPKQGRGFITALAAAVAAGCTPTSFYFVSRFTAGADTATRNSPGGSMCRRLWALLEWL